MTSTNFEVIDNELGDVGLETRAEGHRGAAAPAASRATSSSRRRGSRWTNPRAVLRPVFGQALPDVVSAERRRRGGHRAPRTRRRQALERARDDAAPRRNGGAATPRQPPAPGGSFGPLQLKVHLRIPDNLVLRGKSLRPGGPTARRSATSTSRSAATSTCTRTPAAGHARGTVDTVAGSTSSRAAASTSPAAARSGSRASRDQPGARRHRDARRSRTPASRRACRSPARVSKPKLDALEHAAARRVRHPLADRLQPAGQRARAPASARRWRRRPAASPTGFLASPLGESIGRALDLDVFEITITDEAATIGAGVTVGEQIGDDAFIKPAPAVRRAQHHRVHARVPAHRVPAPRGHGRPETTGAANRIDQRRIERAGIDLIFFFSYCSSVQLAQLSSCRGALDLQLEVLTRAGTLCQP